MDFFFQTFIQGNHSREKMAFGILYVYNFTQSLGQVVKGRKITLTNFPWGRKQIGTMFSSKTLAKLPQGKHPKNHKAFEFLKTTQWMNVSSHFCHLKIFCCQFNPWKGHSLREHLPMEHLSKQHNYFPK